MEQQHEHDAGDISTTGRPADHRAGGTVARALRGWRGLGVLAAGALVLTTCGTRVLTDAEPQSVRIVSVCPTPGLSRVTGCDADRADADVRPTGQVAALRDARAADPTTTTAAATTVPPTAPPAPVETAPPAPAETAAPAPAETAAPAPAPEPPAEEAAPEPEPEPEAPPTTRPVKKKAPAPTPAPAPAPEPPAPPAPEETAPPAPPPADVRVDTGVAGRVVALVNAQRQAAGLGNVSASGALNSAAARHSKDQAATKTMSHTGSDGSTVGGRVSQAGYGWSTVAENVAYGYGSADSVMTGWMGSPGHKKNILNAAVVHIGVAVAYAADGTPYWTMVLAAPA